MASLANWILDVGGQQIGASEPEFARESLPGGAETTLLSVGVAAVDLDTLPLAEGGEARLLTGDGRAVARIRIENVDRDLYLISGEVLELSSLFEERERDQQLAVP